jgi:hypothetical protein
MDRVVPSGCSFVAGVSSLPSDATMRLRLPRRWNRTWQLQSLSDGRSALSPFAALGSPPVKRRPSQLFLKHGPAWPGVGSRRGRTSVQASPRPAAAQAAHATPGSQRDGCSRSSRGCASAEPARTALSIGHDHPDRSRYSRSPVGGRSARSQGAGGGGISGTISGGFSISGSSSSSKDPLISGTSGG